MAPGKPATAEPSHDMAAFDRHYLASGYRLHGMDAVALNGARAPPFEAFGVIQDPIRGGSS